jgi:hypothetical protein
MLWNSYSIAAGAVAKIISRLAPFGQARDAPRGSAAAARTPTMRLTPNW